MAMQSVPADKFDTIHSRIREAIAIQEMVSRMQADNEEDFEMVRLAAGVTFRLLEEANATIGEVL